MRVSQIVFTAILLLLGILSWPTKANMALSDYRLFFSPEQRSNAIQIRNTSNTPLKFTTQIVHYSMTEEGTLIAVSDDEAGEFSAKRLIRYSPKRATISGLGIQALRFSVRKPRGLPEGEYRAVLKITGSSVTPTNLGVNVKPRLSYNLPIIIRHGKMVADVEHSQPTLTYLNNTPQLQVWQIREGNRSLYGSYVVLDESGKEVGEVNGVGLYPPLERRKIKIPLAPDASGKLTVKFKEDAKYGGSLIDEFVFQLD